MCTACLSSDLRSHYMQHVGWDRLGRALVYSDIGMARDKSPEKNAEHCTQVLELLEPHLRPFPNDQYVWVVDFHKFGVADMSPKVAGACLGLFGRSYPERLGGMILVGAPVLFNGLYRAVCAFADPVTVRKVRFARARRRRRRQKLGLGHGRALRRRDQGVAGDGDAREPRGVANARQAQRAGSPPRCWAAGPGTGGNTRATSRRDGRLRTLKKRTCLSTKTTSRCVAASPATTFAGARRSSRGRRASPRAARRSRTPRRRGDARRFARGGGRGGGEDGKNGGRAVSRGLPYLCRRRRGGGFLRRRGTRVRVR